MALYGFLGKKGHTVNNFCLLPDKVDQFKKALKQKEIKVSDLLHLSTEERIGLLREYAGDNAENVNALFESKLVLKNRMIGIKNWASKVGEIGKYSPEGQAQINKAVSEYRAKQMERILNPKENETFLQSLADKAVGTEVTPEEAKQVFELSAKSSELLKEYNPQTENWSSEKAASDYGASKVVYKKYVDNLKEGDLPIKGMLKEYGAEIKNLWEENPAKTVGKVIGDSISTLSNTMINAVASWDNSFLGRQGGITFTKSPKLWWDMAKKSMVDIYQTFKGENPEDILMAQVYSDPDFINGNYKKAGITFGIEEEVPTKIMEKIPVAGKIFKASDVAFTDSAIRARMGLFKIMKQITENSKAGLTDAALRDIGTQVNAITARGKLGQIGTSKLVRALMWAPRMLKADWDILTGHTFGAGLETGFGRKQAAKTTFTVVVATAGLLAIAEAMGAEVEKDPRSSNFLSFKVGNTWFKVPFARGMPQIVTLFSRITMGLAGKPAFKSSTTGIVSKVNTGEYGSKTLFEIGIDFLANKTTPPVGAVIDVFKGKMFGGKEITPTNMALNALPISVQNFIGLKGQDGVAAVGAFLDLFGEGSTTISVNSNWNQTKSKEMTDFKAKVGQEKFNQANQEYNDEYNKRFKRLIESGLYKSMNDEEKQKAVTKLKNEIKTNTLKNYGFKK